MTPNYWETMEPFETGTLVQYTVPGDSATGRWSSKVRETLQKFKVVQENSITWVLNEATLACAEVVAEALVKLANSESRGVDTLAIAIEAHPERQIQLGRCLRLTLLTRGPISESALHAAADAGLIKELVRGKLGFASYGTATRLTAYPAQFEYTLCV